MNKAVSFFHFMSSLSVVFSRHIPTAITLNVFTNTISYPSNSNITLSLIFTKYIPVIYLFLFSYIFLSLRITYNCNREMNLFGFYILKWIHLWFIASIFFHNYPQKLKTTLMSKGKFLFTYCFIFVSWIHKAHNLSYEF